MHINFLDFLCCPITRSQLHLTEGNVDERGIVGEGTLESLEGKRYSIVRGIPRFVNAEQYSESFGVEWNRWPRLQFEDQNAGKPMAGHTMNMWKAITNATTNEVKGKTIVEFGCGPGRFLDVIRRAGGRAVGIDLSLAVEAARQNFKDDVNVLIVQGDILNPPFKQSCFDGGFTIGVLHHTPNPIVGLIALASRIKPGGWLACCVYPKGEFYDFPSVLRWRKINRFAKRFVGYRLALAYSLTSAYLLTDPIHVLSGICRPVADWLMWRWLPVLGLPDRRWRVLDVFDAITPEYASTHTYEEVERWMSDANLINIVHTPWCATSFRGELTPKPSEAVTFNSAESFA